MTFILDTLRTTAPAVASYFAVIAGFLVAERLLPAERNQPVRDLVFSAGCTVFAMLATPFAIVLPSKVAAWAAPRTHGPLLDFDLNRLQTGILGLDWPLMHLVLPLVPLLVFDFFYYWHHRLQHRIPALWEQHKLHHTERSLNCLTNLRHHWLEEPIRVFTITIPMAALIRVSPLPATLVGSLLAYWSLFFHANLRLPLGPLTPVVTGPQHHRIHHSRLPEHRDKNFAAFFPVWDLLFGTYCRAKPGEWPATGIFGEDRRVTASDAVIGPFVAWAGRLRMSSSRPSSTRGEEGAPPPQPQAH